MARIQVSLADPDLEVIDAAAKKSGLSRSAFLTMAALEYIQAHERVPVITSVFSSFANLLDLRVRGEISQEDFDMKSEALQVLLKE